MARPLRIEYPDAYYHVINRGNAGEKIFKNNRDREKFLEYLAIAVERFSVVVHAYCLMSNHFHILLQTPDANLSKAIQWLNVSYATYFNKKHQRQGHLFQGRFKAILIDGDEYLEELSRYIHLNPVQAQLVATPADYAWSSYPAFIGKKKKPGWLTTSEILVHFGKRKDTAIKHYRKFVEEVDLAATDEFRKQISGGFILGDTHFVKWVRFTYLTSLDNGTEIPELRKLPSKVSPDEVFEAVCMEYQCDKELIVTKGKHNSQERGMGIHLARDLCGLTGKELGTIFDVSGASITMRYNQFSKELLENKKLARRVKKVTKQILNF